MDATTSVYLARLGLEPEAPSLAALTRLHVRHLERVPFENLDIQRGVPIRLAADAIVSKILGDRGGFCYELNGAFAWLLRKLGYDVTLLEARVARNGGKDGFGMPFDHLALRVALDRTYLADVGFGDSFLEPLLYAEEAPSQQGAHEYRLVGVDARLILERRPSGGEWVPQYELIPTPRELADFTPGCEYHQTSPESHFTQRPICTRVDGQARVTLHRDRLTRDGESTPVSSEAHWSELLAAHFGIVLPD